jgi:thiamine pyrophosphate-dependent acetolactate synthase large subunit-like protein
MIAGTARQGGSRIGDVDGSTPATGDSVATALVAALVSSGIEMVFGVGGTHTLVLLGAIERAKQLRYVASRTELGAAYMAIGYARTSGKPAVLLTSTGPGALNVTAALQDACWSSVPVIHLTTHWAEQGFAGAVHETPPQNAILRLASKDLIEVDGNFVAEAVTEAVRRARSAPAGPVTLTVKVGIWADRSGQEGVTPPSGPEPPGSSDLADVVAAIDGAARPLVYVGGGALKHDRGRAALALAEVLQAPVLTSYGGKTVAGRNHPLYLGPWSTERLVDQLCAEADLALVLGSKLSASSTNYWNLSLPEVVYRIGFAVETHRAFPRIRELRGDAAEAASALTALVRPRREGWATERIPGIRGAVLAAARGRAPQDMAFVEAMNGPNAPVLVACETAKAGFWVMKFLDVADCAAHVMSGYLAMGSALPMAVGMAAAGEMPVAAVLGDGGLQMSLAEVATLAELALPVTLVVIVDHAYGLLRDNSAAVGGSQSLGIDLWNPDFARFCDAYDLSCVDVHTPGDLAAAFAARADRPRVILVHRAFSRQW